MSDFEKKALLLEDNLKNKTIDKKTQKNSLIWFYNTAQSLNFEVSPKELLTNQKNIRRQIRYGQMYHFVYEPKYGEKLPYYDRFPLVFPVQAADGGFLGLNLHYLDYKSRMGLMRSLYNYQINTSKDNAKIVLSYRILNKAKTLRNFKPCLKRYLYSHIRSNFIKIPTLDWNMALFLPTEQFVKANKTTVWKDTNPKAKKNRK